MGGINYNIAALCIQIVCLTIFNSRSRLFLPETNTFSRVIHVCFMVALFDTLTVITYWYADFFPMWFLYAINIAYYYFFNTITVLSVVFIRSLGKAKEFTHPVFKRIWGFPWFVSVLLIFSTPWTKLVFSFNENRVYSRGPALLYLYIAALYFVIVSTVAVIKERKIIPKKIKFSIFLFLPLSLIPLFIQFLYPHLLVTNLGISISELIILFTILDYGEYTERETNIFNRAGLMRQAGILERTETPYSAVLLVIDNTAILRHGLGVDDFLQLLQFVTNKLMRTINGRCFCAQYAQGRYFQICCDDKETALLISRMTDFFQSPVYFKGTELQLAARICRIDYPRDIQSSSELFRAIVLLSQKTNRFTQNTLLTASDVFKDDETRRIIVTQKIRQAIIEESFIMYLQPIIDIKTRRPSAAEALIRYKDDELGWISPAEFIPLAEQTGLINAIGIFTIKESCRILSTLRSQGISLEKIEVNLSPLQCLQAGFKNEALETVHSFNLEAKDICFEITETAARLSKNSIDKNLIDLSQSGFSIAIDDYGTGYSNLGNLLSIPFDYVKIDKSIVAAAGCSDRGKTLLKAVCALFKPLNVHIIAEGIETEKELEQCIASGANSIQGYYFSKPLPVDEFAAFYSAVTQDKETQHVSAGL